MKKIIRVMMLSALLFLVSCSEGMHSDTTYTKGPFSGNGEKIYFTGVTEDNSVVPTSGGHHHMKMHGGGCVTCHGINREGGNRMWPWFWVTSPALTPAALTGDHESKGHDHAVYDSNSLKRAIIEGVNPAGENLNDLMPRWQMSERDANDLVHFLLGDHQDEH
ncbi:c-type cytochrome [Alkalimarinus alittae]|uniref:Cytochrome c n=1 Tax=Alkalimarinus alittae TaxID=2961619 RepID=A0ABY6MXF3_9ALTE|nr:cytochrome c [Alkalimarinus alittae]UZE94508.1 cytochrome c [Alkalimarinus alittae]